MTDDRVVREWYTGNSLTAERHEEHNALVRAYLAVVAERDEALESRDDAWSMYHTAKAQLAAMTAERDDANRDFATMRALKHEQWEQAQSLAAQLAAMTAERDEAFESREAAWLAAMTAERDAARRPCADSCEAMLIVESQDLRLHALTAQLAAMTAERDSALASRAGSGEGRDH